MPCQAISERRGDAAVLRLVCNFGPLPFTVEGAQQRRQVLQAIAAAKAETGLDWRLSAGQSVILASDVPLHLPSTPAAMIAGVVAVVVRSDAYFGLLLEILGEAGGISAAEAA